MTLKKGKEQTISCRNYYGCRLCRWFSTSCKYNYPRQITGTGSWGHVCKMVYFNREGAISTLSGSSQKLMKFTYLGSSITSAESDVNMHIEKVWTATNRLLIIWSLIYLINKNRISSKQQLCQHYYMDAPCEHRKNILRKSWTGIAQKCYELYWTNPGNKNPRNNICTATYLSSLKPSK